jgi:hypothetical protein
MRGYLIAIELTRNVRDMPPTPRRTTGAQTELQTFFSPLETEARDERYSQMNDLNGVRYEVVQWVVPTVAPD